MRLSIPIFFLTLGLSAFAGQPWWREEAPPVPSAGSSVFPPVAGRHIVIHPKTLSLLLAGEAGTKSAAPGRRPRLIELPLADGTTRLFEVESSPVMEPGLAAQLPGVGTFSAVCVEDPLMTARLDLTPGGFHAIILSAGDTLYIDPVEPRNPLRHVVYSRAGYKALNPGAKPQAGCRGTRRRPVDDSPVQQREATAQQRLTSASAPGVASASVPVTLRTYRLAVMADSDYTAYHGGPTAALTSIVTGVNRLNAIYERDLAVRFVLVANNNLLVFTNADDPTDLATAFTPLIDARIGNANYDVGHLLMGTDFGGTAAVGVVCVPGWKGEGQSGSSTPNNDPFWVDLVSHELGHQFGANHTFNATTSACGGGNRNAATAYEPGSGSTIMAYAGICSPNDLQPFSNDYFHAASRQEMMAFLSSGAACAVVSLPGNHTPSVDAGPDFSIPAGTPFTLTASANDPEGDPMTYCWEELDLGAANSLDSADNGSSPLVRSRPPDPFPSRTLPAWTNLLANTAGNQEKLPALARTMNFRCTARDSRAGGAGVGFDDVALQVVGTAGPFRVRSPNTPGTRSGVMEVTWDVAGTTAAPILCSAVDLLLSRDGGLTWTHTLVAATANDGSENVTLPDSAVAAARIMVRARDNIFFDVSDADFSIVSGAGAPAFVNPGGVTLADSLGNGNANGFADPGESALELFLPVKNEGNLGASGVTAQLAAVTPGVVVVQGFSSYPDLGANATGLNSGAFVVELPSGHACGSPFTVRLTVQSAQASHTVDYTFASGAPAVQQVFAFGGAVAIPDNDSRGVDIPVVVSGVPGVLSDLDFAFTGHQCQQGTGTGLQHDSVSDLTVTLRGPTGVEVVLLDGIGTTGQAIGPHFCGTVLDDAAGGGSIQNVPDTGGPYTGNYTPAEPLSAFNGLAADGTWTLRVADGLAEDAGTVRAFSLRLTGGPVCAPPDPVPPSADLQLAAEGSPAVIGLSPTNRWTMAAGNLGPDPAQAVVLTVPFPLGAHSAVSVPAGVQQGNHWVILLGNLAAGAGKTARVDWTFGPLTPAGGQVVTTMVSSITADPVAVNNEARVLFGIADLDLDTLPDFRDPDIDGDGLPNSWELDFFGGVTNALASSDGDTDGFSNVQEYVSATDPVDPRDFFEIRSYGLQSGNFLTQVPSGISRLYTLQSKDSLHEPAWTNRSTDVPGVAGILQLADPDPPPQRVYQVKVRLAP